MDDNTSGRETIGLTSSSTNIIGLYHLQASTLHRNFVNMISFIVFALALLLESLLCNPYTDLFLRFMIFVLVVQAFLKMARHFYHSVVALVDWRRQPPLQRNHQRRLRRSWYIPTRFLLVYGMASLCLPTITKSQQQTMTTTTLSPNDNNVVTDQKLSGRIVNDYNTAVSSKVFRDRIHQKRYNKNVFDRQRQKSPWILSSSSSLFARRSPFPIDAVISTIDTSLESSSVVDAKMLPTSTAATKTIIRIGAGRLAPLVIPNSNVTWLPDRNYTTNGIRYPTMSLPGRTNCTIARNGIMNSSVGNENNYNNELFCTERYFTNNGSLSLDSMTNNTLSGTYIIPVPRPGMYQVNLYFSENKFLRMKQRIFHILVQGITIRSNFDIIQFAKAPYTACCITIVASVLPWNATNRSSSTIRIDFINVKQYAKINAIEILTFNNRTTTNTTTTPAPTNIMIAPTRSSQPFSLRINAGYTTDRIYLDKLGQQWVPDINYTTVIGGLSTTTLHNVNISNTRDDILYQYERSGDNFIYSIPVPVGEYAINLMFAELVYRRINQRLFTIKIENTTMFENIDIIALSMNNRWRAAVTIPTIVVVVDDGMLNIEFMRSTSTGGGPKIAAIEIKLNSPHLVHAVAGGPYYGTIINPLSNRIIVPLNGETSHTHNDGYEISSVQWKRGRAIIGTTLQLNNTYFYVGVYKVTLTVKDNGNYEDSHATTVTVRPYGYPVITSLIPNVGNIQGNYEILVIGAGFVMNNTVDEITILFGEIALAGPENIEILNSTAIRILRCPPSAIPNNIINVHVRSRKGISDNPIPFNYIGTIPIKWNTSVLVNIPNPTVGRFGPDHKLYIGTYNGRISKITMNANYTQVVNVFTKRMFPPIGNQTNDHKILGIAFDPMDTRSDPDIYFTAQKIFHRGRYSTSGMGINGRIMKASGTALDTVVTIISGLPVSDYDHGLNAIEFGDMGELFFTSGSNTNGGIPGQLSSTQSLKENFLSGGINVAYISHPEFNGTIRWSADDDGNMISKGVDVYGMGLRNPYGILLHSNGQIYATDNGPNKKYGRMSTGCGSNDFIADQERPDKLILVQKGRYYGHPNKKRATYFNDTRQCIWRGPEVLATTTTNHTAPLLAVPSSSNGLIEFHSNHFGGQLRGNIIMTQYRATPSLSRVVLNADGDGIVGEKRVMPLNIGSSGLDITQAPNGNIIEINFANDSISVITPVIADEIISSSDVMIVTTVFPRRGPNTGGNKLSIFGVNFVSPPATTTISTDLLTNVTIGNVPCRNIVVLSSTRIDCVGIPGGYGTVDITVSVTGGRYISSTFERGYRYISGLLPSDFIIPIYNRTS